MASSTPQRANASCVRTSRSSSRTLACTGWRSTFIWCRNRQAGGSNQERVVVFQPQRHAMKTRRLAWVLPAALVLATAMAGSAFARAHGGGGFGGGGHFGGGGFAHHGGVGGVVVDSGGQAGGKARGDGGHRGCNGPPER